MAGVPPSWLNNEFLRKALQNERNDPDIIIVSSEIGAATAVGDNYGSAMYRAIVKFKRNGHEEETSIIIKALPEDSEEVLRLFENSPVFKNEASMFAVVMPEMQKLLSKIKHKTYQPFAAKFIYFSSKPQPVAIVLQDLKKEGFKLAEVDLGLDLNHSLIVMRTIARFHACSMVLYQNNSECLEAYESSLQVSENNFSMKNLLASSLKSVAEVVGRWPDYKDKYHSILNSMVDSSTRHWFNGLKRDDRSLDVLSHGDLWMNNMMFKYSEDTGDIQDVRFVDFQLNYHNSAAADLLYFINTSVSPDVMKDFDKLIAEYYKTLCEILTDLGHEDLQPTKDFLDAELRKRIPFAVTMALTVRAVVFADKQNLPDISKLLRNEESLFVSDKYERTLKEILPLYEKWGWFKSLNISYD